MDQLKQFKNTNQEKKIMVIAGSMQLPFSYYELFAWFETNTDFSNWAFILVGYNNIDDIDPSYFASTALIMVFIMTKYLL
jgi:hypothetical protein